MFKAKLWMVVIALGLISGQGHAARKYGMAGCGLGSQIGVGGPGAGGFMSALAVTTNLFFTQPIGILLGTSNCVEDEGDRASLYQERFVAMNFSALSKEVAQGSGDTLVAFSDALGCTREVFPTVANQLKGAYSEIFAAPGAVSALEAAKEELRKDSTLAISCSHLI